MDKFDWNSQPAWLIAMMVIVSGLIVPIATAVIGKWRSRPDDPAPLPPQPVEVESPWMIQNLTEITLTVRSIKDQVASLTTTVNAMASQINNIASRRRDH